MTDDTTESTDEESENRGGPPTQYTKEDVLGLVYDAHPEPPTMRELADELGCSKGTVYHKLWALEEDGLVLTKKTGGGARAWWVSNEEHSEESDLPEPPTAEKPRSYAEEREDEDEDIRKKFDHEDHGDFAERYSEEDVLAVIREAYPEPLTQQDIADRLGCSKSLLRHKLPTLEGANAIETKKLGARARVYWVSDPGATLSPTDPEPS